MREGTPRAGGLVPAGSSAEAPRAFVNARVWTQDPARPWAAGLIVTNGRVARLLNGGEPPPSDPVVDLHGRFVLPGLVDAHTHLLQYARGLDQVALAGVATLEDALALVHEAAARNPSGWIRGQGWDPHAWGGFPDRRDLDRVAPGRPVVLRSRDCHSVWVSSPALAAAGIDATNPDPEGGRIARDAAGEPTGILLERAARLAESAAPPDDELLEGRLERALREALGLGLTGVHVMDGREGMRELEAYDRNRGLPLRAVCYIGQADLEQALAEGLQSGDQRGRVRLGGLKLFIDGALGSRTALLSEPYEGTDDAFGIALLGDAELADLARRAAEGGLALAVHAIGDRANTRALDALEAIPRHGGAAGSRRGGRSALRHRIEHAQLVFPADILRFGRAGIVASVQPCHIPGDWRAADRHWGDRSRHAYPFRSLLGADVTLALGSDVPVEGWNPWQNLYAAVARRDWQGTPAGGWYAAEAMTLEEAILGYTVGPAIASGEVPSRGRLVPGADADFVAVSTNLFETSPEEWLEARCELTVVAGQIVHAAGDLAEAAAS